MAKAQNRSGVVAVFQVGLVSLRADYFWSALDKDCIEQELVKVVKERLYTCRKE